MTTGESKISGGGGIVVEVVLGDVGPTSEKVVLDSEAVRRNCGLIRSSKVFKP